jgi:thiol-disulfide isomerase/thioredoxin
MFVTPTCPHCLATIPRGAAAAKATGANVVAVFVSGTKANAESVVTSTKYSGVALVDENKAMIKQYSIKAVPYSVVLGPDGFAREAFRGEQDESTLRDALGDAK